MRAGERTLRMDGERLGTTEDEEEVHGHGELRRLRAQVSTRKHEGIFPRTLRS